MATPDSPGKRSDRISLKTDREDARKISICQLLFVFSPVDFTLGIITSILPENIRNDMPCKAYLVCKCICPWASKFDRASHTTTFSRSICRKWN